MAVVSSRSCSRLSSTRICTRSLASRFDSGSSKRNTCGWRTMARPTATRCRHHAQGGRLAAAGWADEDDELLVADVEVHVLDGVHLVVLLVEIFQQHLSHAMSPLNGSPESGAPGSSGSPLDRSGESRDVE